jgi:hypothetical protein
MPTINKLPLLGTPSGGDQIPVYAPNSGDARRMSINTLVDYIEDNIDLPDPTNAADITYVPAGTSAVQRTVQSKLRETISVADFGAVGNGVTDDTAAIQAAFSSVPYDITVVIPRGFSCAISSTIFMTGVGKRLVGESYDGAFGYAHLRWIGPDSGTMLKITNGSHNSSVEQIAFDANALADICLHVEALQGSSTHNPSVNRCSFKGYATRALVFGENDIILSKNGQMGDVVATDLQFRGSKPGALAMGVLLNAQNVEWLIGSGWYFDPDLGTDHSYHIYMRSGGMSLTGLLSTRADTFAIYSNGQLSIDGWRSEDTFLLQQGSAVNPPTTLQNVLQREHLNNLASNNVIQINNIDGPVSIKDSEIVGSISIAPTDKRNVTLDNVRFVPIAMDGGNVGTVVFFGPQNQTGKYQDLETGTLTMRGSSPGFVAKTAAGVSVAELSRRTVFGLANLPTGATPSASGGTIFATTNTGATTITRLLNVTPGQLIILQGRDGGNTTVSDGTYISLAGGASFTLGDGDCLTLICASDSILYELARSNN